MKNINFEKEPNDINDDDEDDDDGDGDNHDNAMCCFNVYTESVRENF